MAENYFDILGVSSESSAQEVEKAYLELIKLWTQRAAVPQYYDQAGRMKEILVEAKNTLIDPTKRKAYVESLRVTTDNVPRGKTGLIQITKRYLDAGSFDSQSEQPLWEFATNNKITPREAEEIITRYKVEHLHGMAMAMLLSGELTLTGLMKLKEVSEKLTVPASQFETVIENVTRQMQKSATPTPPPGSSVTEAPAAVVAVDEEVDYFADLQLDAKEDLATIAKRLSELMRLWNTRHSNPKYKHVVPEMRQKIQAFQEVVADPKLFEKYMMARKAKQAKIDRTPTTRPILDVMPSMLKFGEIAPGIGGEQTFVITNSGDGVLSCQLSSKAKWFAFTPTKLDKVELSTEVEVALIPDQMVDGFTGYEAIEIRSNGGPKKVFVTVTVHKRRLIEFDSVMKVLRKLKFIKE